MKYPIAWVAALLIGAAVVPQSWAASTPPFRTAVQAHLAAVSTRNMDALLPTLTSGTDLIMVAPDGNKFDTRQQYVDFHRQWFAAKDGGKLDTEIVRLIESPALAHALIKYSYSSKDQAGKDQTILSWLTLTFALENGSWRLVFDQNTLIAAPAAQRVDTAF